MNSGKRLGTYSLSAAAFLASTFLTPRAPAATVLQWDVSSAAGIQGGAGTWNTSTANWDNGGTVRVVWNNGGGDTAVFGGTAGGTVTLTSNITAGIVEFDTAGYTLGASASVLTLNSGQVVANYDAAFALGLITPANVALTKSGAGTLTLQGTATNTISGVAIQAGTIAFSLQAQLGATAKPIEFDGGGLRYTGTSALTLTAGRTLVVDDGGGRIENNSGGLVLAAAGQLTGVGTLAKSGTQSLTISLANTAFTGAVDVQAGSLVLQNANALNGRPVTLSGGGLSLRNDASADFRSAVRVTGDSTLDGDRATSSGVPGSALSLGDVTIADGGRLTVNAIRNYYFTVHALDVTGALRVNNAGVVVTGAFTGSGPITFGVATRAPELFTSGLILANGLAQTMANAVGADDAAGGLPTIGVGGANTAVTYTGAWAGGGASATSTVVLHDGANFTLGPAARVNTLTADGLAVRPFVVTGNGAASTFTLDPAFVADHTAGGTRADGLAALEVRDVTLVTTADAGLPVVTAADGFGGLRRTGTVTLAGTGASAWAVTGTPQHYDGGVRVLANSEIRTTADLTHVGVTSGRADNPFQVATPGVTLTKTGAGRLYLSGDQGYAPGSRLVIAAGGVTFNADPGAGWYDGNYTRGASGTVTAPPTPAGTLAVSVGTPAGVNFAAPVTRLDALAVTPNGIATITEGTVPAARTLVVHALTITSGQLDVGTNRLVVDYDPAAGPSPLAALAAMVRSGYNAAGPHWTGAGVVSGFALDDPASFGVGYAEASDVLGLSGTQTGTFGVAGVDASSILIRHTRLGDADLDGLVGYPDFQRLERAYGMGTGQRWSNGDFNYDGAVDAGDFKILYANLEKDATPEQLQEIANFGSTVAPEPGGWVGAAVLAAPTRTGRRRTRKTRRRET